VTIVKRSLAVAVAVLISCVALGACYMGPLPVQHAALAIVDGKPAAIVAVCEESSVDVVLALTDGTPHGEFQRWSATVPVPAGADHVEVPLLGPAGEDTVVVTPLTALEPGRFYALDSPNYGPEGTKAPSVTFTAADLPAIGSGQVLVANDPDSTKVIPLDSLIDKRCS